MDNKFHNGNGTEWLMGWPLTWTRMEPMPPETWGAWLRAFRGAWDWFEQNGGITRAQIKEVLHGNKETSND